MNLSQYITKTVGKKLRECDYEPRLLTTNTWTFINTDVENKKSYVIDVFPHWIVHFTKTAHIAYCGYHFILVECPKTKKLLLCLVNGEINMLGKCEHVRCYHFSAYPDTKDETAEHLAVICIANNIIKLMILDYRGRVLYSASHGAEDNIPRFMNIDVYATDNKYVIVAEDKLIYMM